MKKRISSIRKIFVTVLAAALISGMTEENSETEIQKAEDITETSEEEEITDAETPEEEESTDTEKATETEELTDTEDPTEPEDPEEENPAEPEDPEEEDPTEPGDPEGEDPDGTETPGTETHVISPVTIPPMAMAVPMDTSDSMYAQLEQFLTLIADRFQIYTVAVVELTDPTNPSDPSAWQPTAERWLADSGVDRNYLSEHKRQLCI